MSNLSESDVEYVAALAQLSLDDAAKARLARELDAILGYVEKLNTLDTSDVPPTMHTLDITNVFRADEVEAPLTREVALGNAPETDGAYFLVPRILEQE